MKVVILGKGEMLANLIEGVKDAGFDVVGIFRHERTSMSKLRLIIHDFFTSSPDVTLIKKNKLHEIKCKSANSEKFKREIIKLNADIILVGTWREKLKKEIINLSTLATINVHPSLLPKYRGPNPYIQTILHGEDHSGITFHLMSEELDKGPILAQQKIDILPFDTAKELKEKTVFRARLLVCELLKKLNAGIVKPLPQNENEATYYSNITGTEKMLNFSSHTATEIKNQIRALHPFLPTYITWGKLFFVVNPYKVKIIENVNKIEKNVRIASLTIPCKCGNAVKMSGLRLYKLTPLTRLFLKYFVKT